MANGGERPRRQRRIATGESGEVADQRSGFVLGFDNLVLAAKSHGLTSRRKEENVLCACCEVELLVLFLVFRFQFWTRYNRVWLYSTKLGNFLFCPA
jgi:hypothetical protein